MSRSFFSPSVIRAVASLEAVFSCNLFLEKDNADQKLTEQVRKVQIAEIDNFVRFANNYHELTEGSFIADVNILAKQRKHERIMKDNLRRARVAKMNEGINNLRFA